MARGTPEPEPRGDKADAAQPVHLLARDGTEGASGAAHAKRPCTGLKGEGTPCESWALRGSDRCRWHGREGARDNTPDGVTGILPRLQETFRAAPEGILALLDGKSWSELSTELQRAMSNLPDGSDEQRALDVLLECPPGSEPAALEQLLDDTLHAFLGLFRVRGDASEGPIAIGLVPRSAVYEHVSPSLAAQFFLTLKLLLAPESLPPFTVVERPRPVPKQVAQPTFPEVRALGSALADGPSGRHWVPVDGEQALVHAIPGETLHIKLTTGAHLDVAKLPATCEGLRDALGGLPFAAVLLLLVALGMALERPGHVTVRIDDLLRAIGWRPRSVPERAEMRLKVWRWLLTFAAMPVIGRRRGTFPDPLTHTLIDLNSEDALLLVTGRRAPDNTRLEPTVPPLEVSLIAGPWLDPLRGNRRVLTDFGDVRRIAAIPAGRAAGAWAQSIGLALQQRWRERASRADVRRAGDEGRLTVAFQPFTRRDLLNLFRCAPYVESLLNIEHPGRAARYWKAAIAELRQAEIVGYYAELDTLPRTRKGWAEAWLDQPLDIRPTGETIHAVAEIARKAKSARKKGK